jgi:catechol 2,3-dioxygenase-like lactoylglutathione lyase family enzyme
MAKIKHLAIICRDPDQVKEYYCRWFGFDELNRTPDGSVYLTDGYLNVGLLQKDSEVAGDNADFGLHHIGFHVESIQEIKKRLKEYSPSIQLERRPKNDPYSEWRIRDAETLAIDLSERGYGIYGEKRIPGIRHIATGGSDPEKGLQFYEKIFAMREVEINRGSDAAGVRTRGCVADGFVNICLVKRETNPKSASHFGILIRNPGDVVSHIREAYPTRTELWEPERPGVEFHIRDLEHNAVSLSDKKGWEVDVGKWDRVDS